MSTTQTDCVFDFGPNQTGLTDLTAQGYTDAAFTIPAGSAFDNTHFSSAGGSLYAFTGLVDDTVLYLRASSVAARYSRGGRVVRASGGGGSGGGGTGVFGSAVAAAVG